MYVVIFVNLVFRRCKVFRPRLRAARVSRWTYIITCAQFIHFESCIPVVLCQIILLALVKVWETQRAVDVIKLLANRSDVIWYLLFVCLSNCRFFFSALTPLVGWQEDHLVCKPAPVIPQFLWSSLEPLWKWMTTDVCLCVWVVEDDAVSVSRNDGL